ncbi:MAG: polysaccharide deacetylase family protein [Candidatus Tectimicrobiota bacterium]
MSIAKPPAMVSLDLDNQWAYMRVHGDAGWEDFPSYLPRAVPRILHVLAAQHLRITVFVVGQDAARDENGPAIASIAAAGHEIGNHSFEHLPWMKRHSEGAIEDELARTEEHILRLTRHQPVGFRGPGFGLSEPLLRVLARRGYLYDATTFPTFIGPLARAMYFARARFDAQQAEQLHDLYGGLRDGLRPLRPYRWQLGQAQLLELPVTTCPLLRAPIHLSYLLYLAQFSRPLALGYFRLALRLCRLTATPVSLLLHPTDFLGADEIPALAFFPGMQLSSDTKTALVQEVLALLQASFDILPLATYAQTRMQAGALPLTRPVFT